MNHLRESKIGENSQTKQIFIVHNLKRNAFNKEDSAKSTQQSCGGDHIKGKGFILLERRGRGGGE